MAAQTTTQNENCYRLICIGQRRESKIDPGRQIHSSTRYCEQRQESDTGRTTAVQPNLDAMQNILHISYSAGSSKWLFIIKHFHWSGRICAVYESTLHLLCLRGETTGIAWASSSTCLKLESLRTRTSRRGRQVKKEDTWEGSRALLLQEGWAANRCNRDDG